MTKLRVSLWVEFVFISFRAVLCLLEMSLSSVQSTLSTLKSCQTDVGACMDMISDVALGIVEAQGMDNSPALKKLEEMILECSRLDREINCFVESVEEKTTQVRREPPEAMVHLSNSVKEHFNVLMAGVSDADLQRHSKVVAFKEGVRKYAMQGQTDAENEEEELDEDIAVTQSQTNFTCPITQAEMVNPVKNKKCKHYYDQDAILGMIKAKHKNKKKFRCPKVGCDNKDVQESDLELDLLLKKMIQNHKRQSKKT